MFEDSDEEEDKGPTGTFQTYLAEGERLYLAGNYKKALVSYDLALEVGPENLSGYVARSKCHLSLGDTQAALKDAETTLEDDPNYYRGIYAKAEALYYMGDFEFALVFYHRGNKLRPEVPEFRLGIQKSAEAIDNCVGSPHSINLKATGDLSYFECMDEGKGKSGGSKSTSKCPRRPMVKGNKLQAKSGKGTSNKAARAMLGELYADKEYLEKLLKDDDLSKGGQGNGIYELVVGGLNYLDTRQDLWRQQMPMYARKRDAQMFKEKWSSKTEEEPEPTAFILKNLEKIDAYLAEGKAQESLELTNATMSIVEKMSLEILPNKDDILANLFSCKGNSYLEMGDLKKALRFHQEDYEISKDLAFLDAKSRALDNLGRVHARSGNYQEAIDSWESKISLTRSPLEATWLRHEIGRCYLEIDDGDSARENGLEALEEAKKASDKVWQLNANVLIAQAEVKREKYGDAITAFRTALELSKSLEDEAAEMAVTKALEDVTIKRSKQFRQRDKIALAKQEAEDAAERAAEEAARIAAEGGEGDGETEGGAPTEAGEETATEGGADE